MTDKKTYTDLANLNEEYRRTFNNEAIVFGDGSVESKVLLIGEAPGKDEVAQGKPFVGAAGKNLNEFISILNITREDIYITNVVKYRLSKLNAKTNRLSNRPATVMDISINQPWLLREIEVINPSIIVTLGNVPLRAVTNDKSLAIGSVHGKLLECKINGVEKKLYPLYHPASIIYNRSLRDVYIKDVKELTVHIKTVKKQHETVV